MGICYWEVALIITITDYFDTPSKGAVHHTKSGMVAKQLIFELSTLIVKNLFRVPKTKY